MSVSPIDLSRLPVPDIVETIDFESLLAERKTRLVSLYPTDQQADVAATLELESEPMTILLEENAYREVVLRQRVNDAARAVMLAYAKGTDLDHLAALFDVARLTLVKADPEHKILQVEESDTDLRKRTQLAPQGFSVAGPEGAYISHALNASAQVLDVSATSPTPCEVLITVLSRIGDGSADDALIDAVKAVLQDDDVRPLTDKVTVQSAEIVRYEIRATLIFFAGPDAEVVLNEAQSRCDDYVTQMHKLGMAITLDGIYAASRPAGVQRVILGAPLADIPIAKQQAPFCTKVTLSPGGIYV